MAQTTATRKPLAATTRQYDRIARFYSTLEPLYLIFPPARRKAVAALGLKPGDTVLEIGAGSGRNFPYLVEAVGPSGTVIGLDASKGMLAEARKLIERHGWSNVQLLHQDAAQLQVDRNLDGVLFSLSYSVLPDPRPALARAWERLRPSSRVVVMDMGLTQGGLYRLLAAAQQRRTGRICRPAHHPRLSPAPRRYTPQRGAYPDFGTRHQSCFSSDGRDESSSREKR